MYLRTLGGLELSGSGLSRPKPLLLLAYLCAEGVKKRRDLAELFYLGTSSPLASLRVALKQLRDEAEGAVETTDTDVRALLESDVGRLLRALEIRDDEVATALYQGPFLEGNFVRDNTELEEWVYATREYLAEQVRAAYIRLADGCAEEGKAGAAARFAEKAYRLAGAPAPGPEVLAHLHTLLWVGGSVLASQIEKEAAGYGLTFYPGTAYLGTAVRTSAPEVQTARRTAPHNLLKAGNMFVGRTLELQRIADLIAKPEVRVLTLLGLGGMGKTRLALEAAQQLLDSGAFEDGVFAVYLEAVTQPGQLAAHIAEAVELAQSERSLEALCERLRDRELLLILDNFEQLLPHAKVLSVLSARCSRLKLLVTSRSQLDLDEEWVLELTGLAVPEMDTPTPLGMSAPQEAMDLFVQRAKRARLEFALDKTNVTSVLSVCRLVQGSPLGIELAAAWIKIMSPAAIVLELERSLDILTSHQPHRSKRHTSIRASFETSWQNLTPLEQRSLSHLCIFPADFSREAANEVAGATIPHLMSLAQKSMLRMRAEGRYDLHPLLRRFGLEKLAQDARALRFAGRQHARYYRQFVAQQSPRLEGPDSEACLQELGREFPQLNVALEFAIHAEEVDLLADLFWPIRIFWYFRRDLAQDLERFGRILAFPKMRTRGPSQLKLKLGAVALFKDAGELARAGPLAEDCEALARELGVAEMRLFALSSLGDIATTRCDYFRAQGYYDEALNLAACHPDPLMRLGLERSSAQLDYLRGQFVRAASRLERLLDLYRGQGHIWQLGYLLEALANAYRDSAEYAKALGCYEESLAIFEGLSKHSYRAVILMQLGILQLYQGNHGEAGETLRAARTVHTRRRALLNVALCDAHLADLAMRLGDLKGARQLLRGSLLTLQGLNAKAELLHLLDAFVCLLALSHRPEAGRRLAHASRRLHAELEVGQSIYRQELLAGYFPSEDTDEALGASTEMNLPLGKALEQALEATL